MSPVTLAQGGRRQPHHLPGARYRPRCRYLDTHLDVDLAIYKWVCFSTYKQRYISNLVHLTLDLHTDLALEFHLHVCEQHLLTPDNSVRLTVIRCGSLMSPDGSVWPPTVNPSTRTGHRTQWRTTTCCAQTWTHLPLHPLSVQQGASYLC